MKKLFEITILFFISINIFAQNKLLSDESIVLYRSAKAFYDEKQYGKALKYAEDAITTRLNGNEEKINFLTKSLASKTVKAAGDNINSVIAVLQERGEIDCINLINLYTRKKGLDFFDNSISNLIEYLKQQKEFPEAQKLIGDIYKIEGEYDFAEEYYKKALLNENILDIPDEKYEILYLLADLSRLKEDYDKMELRLLNIIGSNQIEKNKSIVRAIKNTVKADKKENVNKLFQLYRTYDYYSLNAYSMLADYYYSLGELEKAFEYSSLAMLNGFTRVCQLLEKRNLEFSYDNLIDFFDEIPNYSDILEWGRVNSVWKNFNIFSDICADLGYTNFSMEFLEILAFHSPEKYWQQEAVLKLDYLDGIKNPETSN